MGAKSGDKARHNRERRKKLARRVSARELRTTLSAQAATSSSPFKPGAAKHSVKK
jgi:hypothetical protein